MDLLKTSTSVFVTILKLLSNLRFSLVFCFRSCGSVEVQRILPNSTKKYWWRTKAGLTSKGGMSRNRMKMWKRKFECSNSVENRINNKFDLWNEFFPIHNQNLNSRSLFWIHFGPKFDTEKSTERKVAQVCYIRTIINLQSHFPNFDFIFPTVWLFALWNSSGGEKAKFSKAFSCVKWLWKLKEQTSCRKKTNSVTFQQISWILKTESWWKAICESLQHETDSNRTFLIRKPNAGDRFAIYEREKSTDIQTNPQNPPSAEPLINSDC